MDTLSMTEIYAITEKEIGKDTTTGLIKVGYSGDVYERIEVLQVGNARELVLLFKRPGTPEEEAALHKRFEKYWVDGEWFREEGELATWVAEGEEKYGKN
jgi:hypothetical protein